MRLVLLDVCIIPFLQLKLTDHYSALRVTVTATNGIENARIWYVHCTCIHTHTAHSYIQTNKQTTFFCGSEIRVYPQGQTRKFPTKPSIGSVMGMEKEKLEKPMIRLATPTQPKEWYTGPDIPVA